MDQLAKFSPNIKGAKKGITITAKNFDIKAKEPNCYIFCCSRPGGVFTSYDSAFYLPKPEILSDLLVNLLTNQLTSADLEEPEYFPIANGQIHIKVFHREVTYFDQNALIFDENNIEEVIANNESEICFSKYKKVGEKNYAREKEYRFCFFVLDKNGNRLSVKKDPKYLSLKPVPHALHSLCTSFTP